MKRRYGGGEAGETEGADTEEWRRGRFGNDGGLRGKSSPKRGTEERNDVGNKGTSAAGEGGSRARGRGGVWSRARQGARRVSKRSVKTRRGGQRHGWGSRPNQTHEKQRVVAVVDETGWWVVVGGGGGWWWWVRGHVEGCARARKMN